MNTAKKKQRIQISMIKINTSGATIYEQRDGAQGKLHKCSGKNIFKILIQVGGGLRSWLGKYKEFQGLKPKALKKQRLGI